MQISDNQPNEIYDLPPGGAATFTDVFARDLPAAGISALSTAGTEVGSFFFSSSSSVYGTGTAAAPVLIPLPPNRSLSASGSLPKML